MKAFFIIAEYLAAHYSPGYYMVHCFLCIDFGFSGYADYLTYNSCCININDVIPSKGVPHPWSVPRIVT